MPQRYRGAHCQSTATWLKVLGIALDPKKPVPKSYTVGIHCITFLPEQNYSDREEISGCLVLGMRGEARKEAGNERQHRDPCD